VEVGGLKTIDVWRIVTLSETGRRLRIPPSRLAMFHHRYETFPKPFLVIGKVKLWDFAEIRAWLQVNAPYGYKVLDLSQEKREKLRQEAREKYDARLRRFTSPAERVGHHGDDEPHRSDGEADGQEEQFPAKQHHEHRVAVE
jgi:hypothetical protein